MPATHYYVFTAPEATDPASGLDAEEGLVVGVEPFAVDPPYDRDQLVYRVGRDSSEVGFYNYHRWASPLGHLLSVAVAEGLRGTPGIAAIEPASVRGRYSARLRGRVIRIEEIDLPAGPSARLELELKLESVDDEVLWSEVLAAEVGGQADDVLGIMEQMQQAFEEVLGQARRSLGGDSGLAIVVNVG
jgi:uncharacterized lipoprotein YmbA